MKTTCALLLALAMQATGGPAAAAPWATLGEFAPPPLLSQTGLYSDIATHRVSSGVLQYTPQYPLWSDGATKRRWIALPAGAAIDASHPNAFDFPVGTKLWKEFSFGRRVETRYLQRNDDGSWTFATYIWNDAQSDATLAEERGVPGAVAVGAGLLHDIPGRYDCLACHQGRENPVLGFTALQLSSDRDPLAPHAERPAKGSIDLRGLVERGRIVGLPAAMLAQPPRIVAATARARAALGYLQANCGGCHNDTGPLSKLGMSLEVRLAATPSSDPRALSTAVGRESHFGANGSAARPLRIAPGDPEHSVLLARMRSRNPLTQMPPLGTHMVDSVAVDLVAAWIETDLASTGPTVASRGELPIALANSSNHTNHPIEEEIR